ncbi:hypothetical protein PR048_011981 [Dryococelus australis]|uniref:Major facilitator superfamily (MFS) profile domain-containing protein n=1 Tax=Dryococelus australis TaxID=614101 RepID=A0ABQ9HN23_9NEOP|nr:hypothetical protein PR048_011981 [Dryococelus australis]
MQSFCHGTNYGWLAPVQPLLLSTDNPVGEWPMTEEDTSMAGSIISIAACLAVPAFTHLGNTGSRKMAGYLAWLPLLPGWLLIVFARSQNMLLVGRFVAGLNCGSTASMMLLVNEISEDSIRGELCTFGNLFFNAGVLFSYVVGSYFSYRTFGLACLGASLIFLTGFYFIPESPYYLMELGKTSEAKKSLQWYWGKNNPNIEEELGKILKRINEIEPLRWSNIVEAFSAPGAVKSLFIGIALCINAHFCGLTAIISYSVKIFQESGTNMSPYGATILVGALRFASIYFTGIVVDRVGRKVLLIASNVIMTVSLLVLGGYFFIRQTSDVGGYGWVPVVCICTFIISVSFGVGSLTFVMVTELFSFKIRSVATMICHCLLSFNVFVVVRTFPVMKDTLTLPGCYWFYASVCAVGVLFAYFCVPETKNRSLESIQAQISGRVKTSNRYKQEDN